MRRIALGAALVGWLVGGDLGAGQDPPSGLRVAGVSLGDRAPAVVAALGRPDRRQESLGLVFWDYEGKGLSLMWDRDRPVVQAIVLKKKQAGAVEGVHVGDSRALLRARWGEPARVRQEGRFQDFLRSYWVQTAELGGGRVVEITVLAR